MTSGTVVNFDQLDSEVQQLIHAGCQVRSFSYSPYSKFSVGSALLCDDGSVHTGCNIENASFPVTLCAERCAIGKAISEGKQNFRSISVVAEKIDGRLTSPCGMCRQALNEFGDFKVYITCPEKSKVLITTTRDLLPYAFQKGINDNFISDSNSTN